MSHQSIPQRQQSVIDDETQSRFLRIGRADGQGSSSASQPGSSEQSQISSWLFSKSDHDLKSSRDPLEPQASFVTDVPLVIMVRCMAGSEIALPPRGLDRHVNWVEITLGNEWSASHSNSRSDTADLLLLAEEVNELTVKIGETRGLAFTRAYLTGMDGAGLVAWRLFFNQPGLYRGIAMFSENRPMTILQPSQMENNSLNGQRVLLGAAFGRPVTGTLAVGRYLHALGMEVTTRLRFPNGDQFYSDLIDWIQADPNGGNFCQDVRSKVG